MTTMGLRERIDAIEETYEFMLAYAAQGKLGNEGGPGPYIRDFLVKADAAMTGLGDAVAAAAEGKGVEATGPVAAFVQVLRADVDKAQAIVQFVLSEEAISSQLIDNLNASIHVRTLLTDIFLADEILKA